jgi:hypothetical protein
MALSIHRLEPTVKDAPQYVLMRRGETAVLLQHLQQVVHCTEDTEELPLQ